MTTSGYGKAAFDFANGNLLKAELKKHSRRTDRATTVGKTTPISAFATTVQLEFP